MKRLFTASLLLLGFAGSAIAADLNICVEGAYPPFSFTSQSGEVEGFDIDIANALCDEMGMTCELVKTDWAGIIPALLERKCDAIIASMSITEERKNVIDFSTKYYNTPARFAGPEGTNMADLAGKTVGVQRGSIHQAFMVGEYPDIDLKLYGSQDEVFRELSAGRVDAIMADSIAILDRFLSTPAGAGFAFFGEAYSIPEYHGMGAGIGVRQGEEELRNAFSHAIGVIRGTGTYQEINAKYFEFDIFGG